MKIISKDFPVAFNKCRVFEDSIEQLANDFNLDETDSRKRTEIVDRLYHELERLGILSLSKTNKMIMKHLQDLLFRGLYR